MVTELPQACVGFDEDLSALIDEELSPARESELRAHLDGCDRCALRLQELCNVDLELAGLAQPAASPELARGLAARIAADASAPEERPAASAEPSRARSAPPRTRRRWLEAAPLARIAVAAGLVLAAWLLLRGDDGVAPETPIARTQPEEVELPIARTQPQAPELPQAELEETPIVEVAPELPETQIARTPPAPGPAPETATTDTLAELPVEDLAMLLELRDLEDLDLIANLELLETLVELERGA